MNSGQIFGRGIWVALKFCIDHDRVEFRIWLIQQKDAQIAKHKASYMLCFILFLSEDRYGPWAPQLQSLLSTLQCGPVRRCIHNNQYFNIPFQLIETICS